MKARLLTFLLVAFLATGLGCRMKKSMTSTMESPSSADAVSSARPSGGTAPQDTSPVRSDRMLIWKADLTLRVADVGEAVAQAAAVAQKREGYVEKSSVDENTGASLTLRVPVAAFQTTLNDLQGLGVLARRSVESEDVTEQYVDVEARMKAKMALRDRLLELLGRAGDMKDTLAVETELNRVQSDIDSMQARLKVLKGQVELATVVLHISRRAEVEKPQFEPIPGPVTLIYRGVAWVVGKLFWVRK